MLQSSTRAWHKAKSILVVDDHPIVRRGVRSLLEWTSSFEVVGEAGNGLDALALAEALRPDIVVTDLSMPRQPGVEFIVELRKSLPSVEIVVFTLHRSDLLLAQSIEAGARAYVCKSETDDLIPALEAVARHESHISRSVTETLGHVSSEEMWDRRPLTMRERQVVRLVAEGRSNKEIAGMLDISIKTTETHRAAAMRKTGSNSAASLTLYAARNHLVDL